MCAIYQPIQQKKHKMLCFWVLLSAALILTGCAVNAPVKTDMAFSPKTTKIDKHVLLEIPQNTKNYIAKTKSIQVPLGQAIEPNALTAFSSIINNVTIKKDSQAVDRVIVLTITEETGMDLGTFTFSTNTFHTSIKCEVKMPDGRVVWSKNVNTQSSAQSSSAGITSQIPILGMVLTAREMSSGDVGYTGAVRDAANDSLKLALQQLVDEIYVTKKEVF